MTINPDAQTQHHSEAQDHAPEHVVRKPESGPPVEDAQHERPHGITAQPRRRRLAKAHTVADFLGLPLSTLYDRARADPPQVPGVVRIGRLLRFDLDQVEAWVDQGGDASTSGAPE